MRSIFNETGQSTLKSPLGKPLLHRPKPSQDLVSQGTVALRTRGLAQGDGQRTRIIAEVVALSTGVSVDQLLSQTRSTARAARARQICMYLAYVALRWPLTRIGRAFGRDRTTVGYACKLIEDMRDDKAFDALLGRLEACLENMPSAREVKLLSPNLREMSA